MLCVCGAQVGKPERVRVHTLAADTCRVEGRTDNSPVPYLGTFTAIALCINEERQQMDTVLETAFNDWTGDWAQLDPTSSHLIYLFIFKRPDIQAKRKQEVSCVTTFFCLVSASILLWRVFLFLVLMASGS